MILFVDELMGNLDFEFFMDILCLFEDFNNYGIIVFIVIYDIGFIVCMCYCSLMFKDGCMIEDLLVEGVLWVYYLKVGLVKMSVKKNYF